MVALGFMRERGWRKKRRQAKLDTGDLHRRRSFPQIQEVLVRLETHLRGCSPGKVHDMSDIFSRESMDVIG